MASVDIDDLIASFKSSSNISQESIDLAALQDQLSASLMRGGPVQCPTTPTMSSMQLAPEQSHFSQGGSFGQNNYMKRDRKGTLVSSRPTLNRYNSEWERQRQGELEDERDMEMIENSLLGGGETYQYQQQQAQRYHVGGQWSNHSSPTMSPPVSEPSFAAYAAMDPFFAAQLQSTQAQPFGQAIQITPGYGFANPRSTFASS